jgi:hypothetical protein
MVPFYVPQAFGPSLQETGRRLIEQFQLTLGGDQTVRTPVIYRTHAIQYYSNENGSNNTQDSVHTANAVNIFD